MEKSHHISGSTSSYALGESFYNIKSSNNNRRTSIYIRCRNTTIEMETSKKPTNAILVLLRWCLCLLSIINFRSQILRIRVHESVFTGVDRSLGGESTIGATFQEVQHPDISTTMDAKRYAVTLLVRSLTNKPRIDDISQQRTLPNNTTNSASMPSHIAMSRLDTKAAKLLISQKVIDTAKVGGALCIQSDRWYGRTFNRILELSNALAIISDDASNNTKRNQEKQTFIGLAPNLSEWYETFLDPREDIVLNYTGPCISVWESKDLFFIKEYKNTRKSRQQLQGLIPKREFREEAEQALAIYSKNGQEQVITVHRRHLEGVCVKKAMGVSVACVKDRVVVKQTMSTNALLDTCNYDYTMIQKKHQSDLEQNKSVVVLCTDQQVPELDDTFPIRANYSFPVEAWLMTKSDIHYGNPHSTVDLVVAVWRTGQHRRTNPEECYEEN